MDEWLPIDTAPRFGWVLCWSTDPDWEVPCMLRWVETWNDGHRWDDGSGDSFQDYKPTHWLPIPAPPSKST